MNEHHKTDVDLELEKQEIKAAVNNPTHFNVLYERYFKVIYVFIYRRTGDQDLSSDITSQVFLRALINIKKYKFRGLPFSSWLFRIAYNEVNMFFRKKKTNRVVSIEQSGIQTMVTETEVETLNKEEAITHMTNALSQLKDEEVTLVELRYFEQRSFAEVAAITGITENNAKVKVYRIIDKLKKYIKIK